jgi:hypothetical protein
MHPPAARGSASLFFFSFFFSLELCWGARQILKPQSVKIKTHKSGQYVEPHFFILSKGNNAGKPLTSPCPNCFVLIAGDAKEREALYWLCFGLWQGGLFLPYLSGSVIPFIHVDDLRKVIQEAWDKVVQEPDNLTQLAQTLSKLADHQEKIKEQLKLINELKRAVMFKLLK